MMTEKLVGGKSGGPAAQSPEANPGSKWFGRKNAAAMVVGVGMVAALVFAKNCGTSSGPEPIARSCPSVTAPAPVAACPAPVPNICNLTLGEHDSASPNWAPEKCGYCGDNIQQQWENPDNCPVDFHCGDGQVNRGTVYGAVIPPSAQDGVYSLGTVTVNESCTPNDPAYCQADCPTRGGAPAPASSDRRRRRDTAEAPPTATVTPPRTTGAACDPEITARFTNRVSSSLLGNPGAARSAAGDDSGGQKTVRARVTISISNGVPSVSGISVSCPGCSGGSLSPGTISLGGIPLDRGASCTAVVSVNIPPG